VRLLVSCRFAPYSETPRLAARHGLPVVERDATWHESFGPGAWLAGGRDAQIQIGHGTTPVGSVVVVTARDRWWEADCVVESDDPKILERIRVGTPISVGFDPVTSSDDQRTHVRQHRLARLKHLAVLRRGEIPAYLGAKITSVTEAKARKVATTIHSGNRDWRAKLPVGWQDAGRHSDEPPAELIEGRTVTWRWNGTTYVRTAARLAA